MKKRRGGWIEYRELIFEYLGNTCNYCGTVADIHVHHIIPLYLGGQNTLSNVELACDDCHALLHKEIEKIFPKKPKDKFLKEKEFKYLFNLGTNNEL